MRSRKYRVVTTLEQASNRLIRSALRAGFAPRAFALLETTGRRTGLARHTPVGNGLDGDTFWLVAAHGMQADYVHACAVQAERLLAWAAAWPHRTWAVEGTAAWAICWPSSCWRPASRWRCAAQARRAGPAAGSW
jgi:F420H(2)-dependent quinone reductase